MCSGDLGRLCNGTIQKEEVEESFVCSNGCIAIKS